MRPAPSSTPDRRCSDAPTWSRRPLATGVGRAVAAASLLAIAAGPAAAQAPADSLRALGPMLSACWRPPPGSDGSEITVLFSLRRDGSLLGRPRITYSRLVGDMETQRAFVAAALGGLSACLPARITDGLGGAIAGRPLTMRFGTRTGLVAMRKAAPGTEAALVEVAGRERL